MIATIISLVISKRSEPVELVIYCAGTVLDLEFESVTTAKTVGTVIVLGILSATHLAFLSLATYEAAPWLPASPAIFIGFMAAGIVVYASAVGSCWSVGSRPKTQHPVHVNTTRARLTGIGTAVFVLLLWIAGTLGLTFGLREYTRSLVCQSHLRQIYRVLVNHMNENLGCIPSTLTILERREYLPRLPHCSKTTADERYVYLCDFLRSRQFVEEYWDCISSGPNGPPGLYDLPPDKIPSGAKGKEAIIAHLQKLHCQPPIMTLQQPSLVPLAWESGARHGPKNLMNVLFADGHIVGMTRDEFRAHLKAQRQDDEHLLVYLIRKAKPWHD
jgi:prepilin-type processing-associated H-X9-DG protein